MTQFILLETAARSYSNTIPDNMYRVEIHEILIVELHLQIERSQLQWLCRMTRVPQETLQGQSR